MTGCERFRIPARTLAVSKSAGLKVAALEVAALRTAALRTAALRTAALAGAASLGLVATAGAAAAGAAPSPCGGGYAVDAPTSLARVAGACGVSLAALREANPGVDPADVRPGQHLAVPPARPQGAAAPTEPAVLPAADGADVMADALANAGDGDEGRRAAHPYIVSPDAGSGGSARRAKVASPLGPQWRDADGTLVDAVEASATAGGTAGPVWLAAGASGNDARGGHYGGTSRMTFQKQSAIRIRNAGYGLTRLGQAVLEPASPDGVPAARFTKDSAVAPTIEPDTAGHADGYTLPDYASIGKLPSSAGATKIGFALTGHVKSTEGGCLLLQSADNVTWRLAMPSDADTLIGKTLTAWGVKGAGASCGDGPSMLVSHAVYAEPW